VRRCPKCEAPAGSDADSCLQCGTPIDLARFADTWDEEGAPLLDRDLERFDTDPEVSFCPVCLNEFDSSLDRCRRCGDAPLQAMLRSRFEDLLIEKPIRDTGRLVAAGPPELPVDLVRVAVATSLSELRALQGDLAFMGLHPLVGSDSLDPFDDPGLVGVYVRRKERESAAYVVETFSAEDPLDRPPEPMKEPGAGLLDEAQGWMEIGKYVQAVRLCDLKAGEAEAELLASRAILFSGKVHSARDRIRAAASEETDEVSRGRLLAWLGLVTCLGHDGVPFGEGADGNEARTVLDEAVPLAPRHLVASKTLIEILDHLGDSQALRKELARVDRVNPNLLARTGPFRQLRAELLE